MIRSAVALAMILLRPVVAQAQESHVGPRTHVVEKGNTLWGLARMFYGDAYEWTRIFEANRDRIRDPEELRAGLELVIPSANGASHTAGAAGVSGIAVVGSGAVAAAPPFPGGGNRPGMGTPRPDSDAEEERTFGLPTPPEGVPAGAVPPGSADLRGRHAGSPVYIIGAFNRAPWLVPHDVEPVGQGMILGFADPARGGHSVQPFDRVTIATEGSLPAVGTRLQAFRIERDAGPIGRVVRPMGTLTVVEATSTGVLAEAEDLYGRMAVGDGVRPLPAPPVSPDEMGRPVTDDLRVRVIGFAEARPLRLPGDYVFIRAGTSQGLRAGDVLQTVPVDTVEGGATVHVVAVHDEYATGRLSRVENPMFGIGVELGLSRRVQ
jgi:hypothetical protein